MNSAQSSCTAWRAKAANALKSGIAAAALAGLAVTACAPPHSARLSDEEVDKKLINSRVGSYYAELKADFPDFYATQVRQAIGRPDPKDFDAAIARAGEVTRRFSLSHARDLAAAPPEALADSMRAQAETLAELQMSSPEVCAALVGGGVRPRTALSPAALAAMTRMNVLQTRAMKQGMTSPTSYPAAPTSKDFAELVGALDKTHAPSETLGYLLKPTTLHSASAAQKCGFGVTFTRAVISLPDEKIARWAHWMAQGQGDPAPSGPR